MAIQNPVPLNTADTALTSARAGIARAGITRAGSAPTLEPVQAGAVNRWPWDQEGEAGVIPNTTWTRDSIG